MGKSYNTNLASEFYVLASLYRMGADASLTLGNKKSVDITVVRSPQLVYTVDVKGVADEMDWPSTNISSTIVPTHFVVLLSFEGKISQPEVPPSVWVIPHADIPRFQKHYKGMSVVSRARIMADGKPYRDNWSLILK